MKSGIYWFTHDLRVADNPLLQRALNEVDCLVAVYIVPPLWTKAERFGLKPIGHNRWLFIKQCLADLSQSLESFGVKLQLFFASPLDVFSTLVDTLAPDLIYCAQQVGLDERRELDALARHFSTIEFVSLWQDCLLNQADINEIGGVNGSFTGFRKRVESLLNLDARLANPRALPDGFCHHSLDLTLVGALELDEFDRILLDHDDAKSPYVAGGERAALTHLAGYFNSDAPFVYKQTRNDIDNFASSTKFSAWLAQGCLSPQSVWAKKVEIEQLHGANQSTYWIGFELLWREFFHWLALSIGHQLFDFKGSKKDPPLTSFHAERFAKWCAGHTPFPIVNACIKQLKQTGYLSNRGRQLVASCLVNELNLDWRYGAAFFQQQLIDYDVASNWGNWQYIAGVGVDPRGGRHFNLAKQTEMYDPVGSFINLWGGWDSVMPLDSVDAADWPLEV